MASDAVIDDLDDGNLAIRNADKRLGRWLALRGSWGFGIGLGLNEASARCAHDAAAYDGVSFWARTTNTIERVSFIVRTRQTDGSCEAAPSLPTNSGYTARRGRGRGCVTSTNQL